ncbi:GNAT family N-acetyltransferase [Desulfosporosinus sp. OT]|uniref:GNAT family N-acetyltransferase n=1 Tax=Desulfosporosinus sp. OT TaxID=913865 RepID=UPI0002239CA2|nr:acetyltransferase [Desulfosporosinus sp. OT]
MTFGPISIKPKYKRKGYGKALLDYSLDKAKALGVGAICIEGNIDFYGKSGFVVASTKGIHYYAEPRDSEVLYCLLKELKDGFLEGITGTYHTPQGYFVDENEVEKFDSHFPAKEKRSFPDSSGNQIKRN